MKSVYELAGMLVVMLEKMLVDMTVYLLVSEKAVKLALH